MTFFLQGDWRISSDYNAPRKTKAGIHRAWDFPIPEHEPGFAPEKGPYHFQIFRHNPGARGDFWPQYSWPDGSWWPYYRYYERWAGGVCVLFGAQYTHVFLHVNLDYIYSRWRLGQREYKQGKVRGKLPDGRIDYTAYLIPEINWKPYLAEEGDCIFETGTSGYDTASHLHYQLMEPGKSRHDAVDPAKQWPEEYERRRG